MYILLLIQTVACCVLECELACFFLCTFLTMACFVLECESACFFMCNVLLTQTVAFAVSGGELALF